LKGGRTAEDAPENSINIFNYVIANFRRYKFRYGLTIFGLIVCVVFFIIIASLSIGLYEPVEPETPTEEVTPEDKIKTPELLELDDNVKRTIVNWLYFTSVLIFATAGAGVANTMLVSMADRKREIGILRSIGLTRNEIMQIFFTESFLICLVAFVIGSIAGVHLANNIFNYIDIGSSKYLFFGTMRTPPVVIFAASIIVFAVGLAAGILPARRAAKLAPVDALRG
jgi:predicted lysophospholipase L1 biosynthesis ABC-type transport system permease subunit